MTPALALRARKLNRERKMLARSIRRIVKDAIGPEPRQIHRRIDYSIGRVTDSQDELLDLAGRLEAPGPLSTRGLARTWLLVADGSGPMYDRRSDVPLIATIEEIIGDLNVEAST